MIVVRDVFQLHFGKAREATDLLKRGIEELRAVDYQVDRLLVDMTGEYYRLIMETRVESLSKFEEAFKQVGTNERWRSIYAEFVPLVRKGYREVLREVD